jgi:4'-phosphopantetheinyl transferase
LTQREREVLSRMRFTQRRSSWRLGRWTAKLAVAAALDRHGTDGVEILAAADGAPEAFVDGRRGSVEISISHTQDVCFCAVAPRGGTVGCDVELIEDRGRVLARDYFTSAEADLVRRARGAGRWLIETLIWSGKESALKAMREGLRRDTRDVEVDVGIGAIPDPAPHAWKPFVVRAKGAANTMTGWWRHERRLIYTTVSSRPCWTPEELTPRGVNAADASCSFGRRSA